MFQKNAMKTHFLCSTTFSENRAVYEIMWNNMVEPGTPQMAIKRGAKNNCAMRDK
jgi:hypothetical protein